MKYVKNITAIKLRLDKAFLIWYTSQIKTGSQLVQISESLQQLVENTSQAGHSAAVIRKRQPEVSLRGSLTQVFLAARLLSAALAERASKAGFLHLL